MPEENNWFDSDCFVFRVYHDCKGQVKLVPDSSNKTVITVDRTLLPDVGESLIIYITFLCLNYFFSSRVKEPYINHTGISIKQ